MFPSSLQQMPLRVPPELHEAIKKTAQAQGMSLNQYCLYVLARSVPLTQSLYSQKAENLLSFVDDAHKLNLEMAKHRKHTPTEVAPQETPKSRLKKIHARH